MVSQCLSSLLTDVQLTYWCQSFAHEKKSFILLIKIVLLKESLHYIQ